MKTDRRDVALDGVVPAQQRFEAEHLVGLKIGLRLIDEAQLVARYGISDVMLELTAITQVLAH